MIFLKKSIRTQFAHFQQKILNNCQMRHGKDFPTRISIAQSMAQSESL